MRFLQLFLDEAGHSANTGSVVVAGLAGLDEQWVGFDRDWSRLLWSYRVREFHMKDLENFKRDYRSWTKRDQQAFLAAVLTLIFERSLFAVGAAVSVAFFDRSPRDDYPENVFFEDAYHLALQDAFHIIASLKIEHDHFDRVFVTLARNQEYSGSARAYSDAVAHLLYGRVFARMVRVEDTRTSPRLQAADLIAYEFRKACDNPSVSRWPMRQILARSSHSFASKGIDLDQVFGPGSAIPFSSPYYVLKERRPDDSGRG